MNGRVLVWPWHGLLQGGQIKLSDDSYRPHEQPPANDYFERSSVFLFSNPAAADVTPAEQGLAPVGGEFWNKALLQSGWLYGKNLRGWVWLDDAGRRWRVEPTWLSALGAMTTFTVHLKFSLFGEFGAEPETFTKTLTLPLAGMPTTAQLNALAGASRAFDRRITSINVTGSIAVIALGVLALAPTTARPAQLSPYCFLVVRLAGAGSAGSAVISRPYSYGDFWEYSNSYSETVQYLGRHAYTEKSRAPGPEEDTEIVTYGVTRIFWPSSPGQGNTPLDAPPARFPLEAASFAYGKRLIDLVASDDGVLPLHIEFEVETGASGQFDVGVGTDRVQLWRISTGSVISTIQPGSPDTEYFATGTGAVTVRLVGAITATLYTLELSNSLSWEEGESNLRMVGDFAGSSWDIYRPSPESSWLHHINLQEPSVATYAVTHGVGGRHDINLIRAHSAVHLACRRNYTDNIYYDEKHITPAGVLPAGEVTTSAVAAGSYYAAFNPVTQQVAAAETPLSWI